MCGGIVTAFSARSVLPGPAFPVQLIFNLGRIASYSLAGAAAGTIGSAGGYAGIAFPAQAILFVVANVVLVLVGLQLAGVRNPLQALERFGAPLWRRIQPLAARLMPSRSPVQAFAAGAAWGWLPCGLVYGALAAAVFAGSPARGALAMAAFGLGTLPWLLAAGLAAARLRAWMSRPPVRLAAGSGVAAFGAWGLAQAGGLAEGLRQTLLCF
jgi:hypothetical protein